MRRLTRTRAALARQQQFSPRSLDLALGARTAALRRRGAVAIGHCSPYRVRRCGAPECPDAARIGPGVLASPRRVPSARGTSRLRTARRELYETPTVDMMAREPLTRGYVDGMRVPRRLVQPWIRARPLSQDQAKRGCAKVRRCTYPCVNASSSCLPMKHHHHYLKVEQMVGTWIRNMGMV